MGISSENDLLYRIESEIWYPEKKSISIEYNSHDWWDIMTYARSFNRNISVSHRWDISTNFYIIQENNIIAHTNRTHRIE